MSQTTYTGHEVVSYMCIACVILIYLSTIFTIPQFIKLIHYSLTNISSRDPFFHTRQPIISIMYILLYLIMMYLLYPSVLIVLVLINFNIIQSSTLIPLYINDFGNILIFASFFSRAWVLILDRHFSDSLQNWFWRREVNAKESQTNKFIKYGAVFRSYRRIIITSFYTLCIAPVCGVFMFLSYSHYMFLRVLSSIILFFLLWFTLHLIRTKVSVITDEYLIRTELLSTIKNTGPFYVVSGVLYLITVYTTGSIEVSIMVEILCVCVGHLCAIYWSCNWAIRQFEHKHIKSLQTHEQRLRRSFLTTFTKVTHIRFEKIMSHRAGVEAFAKHLADEYGLESMLFIIEMSQYKATVHMKYALKCLEDKKTKALPTAGTEIFSIDKILDVSWMPMDPRMLTYSPYKIALYLYDKYIESAADLTINISSTNRRSLYKAFKELALRIPHHDTTQDIAFDPLVINILYTLFDEALIEIWHLVQMDTFTRFKTTETFERLLHVLYPKETKTALNECDTTKPITKAKGQSAVDRRVTHEKEIVTHKPEGLHIQIGASSISPGSGSMDFDSSDSVEEKYLEIHVEECEHVKHQPVISLATVHTKGLSPARSNSVLSPSMMSTFTPLARPQLELIRAKSSRRDSCKDHDVSTEFVRTSSLLHSVVVPSDIIKTAADFWRINVNALPRDEKLEMGVAIYLTMLSTDRVVQRMFKRTIKHRQEQIELLSLKFLDMICWLIQSLWSRHNNDLNSTLQQLGTLHKKLAIRIEQFNVMLPALHEALSFYFPVRYRLQEHYAIEYIFAYSAEIMMGKTLSSKTRRDNYFKTLEMKYNSEKKKNALIKNNNRTGLKIEHEISAPVLCSSNALQIQTKHKVSSSFHLPNKRNIMARMSPIQTRKKLKLKDDRSNSLSMGLIMMDIES
eukprot:280354_1